MRSPASSIGARFDARLQARRRDRAPRAGRPRAALRRPGPVQDRQRHLRTPGRRPAAARRHRAAAGPRARERHDRASGRRRVRHPARLLHERAGAEDRRGDPRRRPRLPLRVERELDEHRREHRPRADPHRYRERREPDERGRHRLLRGEGIRPQSRARLRPHRALRPASRDVLGGARHASGGGGAARSRGATDPRRARRFSAPPVRLPRAARARCATNAASSSHRESSSRPPSATT